jgi:hypothetical protein
VDGMCSLATAGLRVRNMTCPSSPTAPVAAPRAGLAAVGVALVASAARGLTAGTCKLRVTMAINAAAAVITFYYPATYMFPACILAGGLVTLYTNRKVVRRPDQAPSPMAGGAPGARPGHNAWGAHQQLRISPVPRGALRPRCRQCACAQGGRAKALATAAKPCSSCKTEQCCKQRCPRMVGGL